MQPENHSAADAAPSQKAPDHWAILELMGHQRIAGAVSRDTVTGLGLLRVDVPAVTYMHSVWRNNEHAEEPRTIPAHSRSLSASAIFSIHWVDEAAARLAAVSILASPLNLFSLRSALDAVPEDERQQLLRLSHGSRMVDADGYDDEHC